MAICSRTFAMKLGDLCQMAEITGDAKYWAPVVVGYLGAEFTFPPHKPQTSA